MSSQQQHYDGEVRMVFDLIDVDKSNSIDVHEFLAILQADNPNITFEDAQYRFNLLDTDNSGQVSFEEFQAGCVRFNLNLQLFSKAAEAVQLRPTPPPAQRALSLASFDPFSGVDPFAAGAVSLSASPSSQVNPFDTVTSPNVPPPAPVQPLQQPQQQQQESSSYNLRGMQEALPEPVLRSSQAQPVLNARSVSAALRVFNSIDGDGDGTVSLAELNAALTGAFPGVTDQQVARVLAALDTDGNGTITIDEFLAGVAAGQLPLERLQKGLSQRTGMQGAPATAAAVGGSEYEWEIEGTELAVGGTLGEGAFGTVYAAKWRGAKVAVKELKVSAPGGAGAVGGGGGVVMNEEALDEFRKEVAMLSRLRHPNVVLFLGACTRPPTLLIVTEFLELGTLEDLLYKRQPAVDFNWQLFKKIILQVCLGLNYLHLNRPRIIHRDLKPANCLLDANYGLKLADFGLSVATVAGSPLVGQCGTPIYMAPELLRNDSYGEAVDVYAFAVMVYEMYVRQVPFMGMTPLQLGIAVGLQGNRPLLPPNCPVPLQTIISRGWTQNPEDRPSFSTLIDFINPL